MPISVRRPTSQDFDALLARVADREVTYPEVGATSATVLPLGYRHDRYSVPLGHGDPVFRRRREALQTWQAHRHVGAILTPAQPQIAVGADLVVAMRLGHASVVVPCRIVSVIETDGSYGFAYGTLPGHPERGEEAFHVVRTHDDEVTFEVVAFSRPSAPLARLGGPITRLMQARITRGYLAGVRAYVKVER